LRSRTNYEDPASVDIKVERTYKRMTGIQEQECSICLTFLREEPVTANEIDKFFRTPCNHKFHKSCILKWMTEKQQCPECRAELPPYVDPNMVADDI
tara:strand:+ start:1675 stop:1965 length:291 start_codon:yes stop_codon:yes gene_type:complete